jgi:hypothetical protein
MAKHTAEDYHADELADDLAKHGFKHVRVRRRAATLTIESGERTEPTPHARLRRDTVHLWVLEMPTGASRWAPTPYRLPMDQMVALLVGQLAWALAPTTSIPIRTSGRQY